MTRTIAIDGPSGSGKSSVADRLADALHMAHLDTGAMYRAITLDLLEQGIDVNDEQAVDDRLNQLNLKMEDNRVFLDNRDVTARVRADDVTRNVSVVSGYRAVREKMVAMQQAIASSADVILDGRDIGTVVLPNADLKIFLDATPEERARRRLQDKKSMSTMAYEEVLADIRRRDQYDSTRLISPLHPAEDAVHIDSSNMALEEVVERIIEEWYHAHPMD
ncbi:(d)CMP kinase [Murdochiella massiliensis]|uniref:(d)CMP kinase n=1 Tax=Murdochiella massiliensis TaxID=1673723 RepID=UPI000830A507|nr:(d)CMP kinase [Murdochiella massiliensis]